MTNIVKFLPEGAAPPGNRRYLDATYEGGNKNRLILGELVENLDRWALIEEYKSNAEATRHRDRLHKASKDLFGTGWMETRITKKHQLYARVLSERTKKGTYPRGQRGQAPKTAAAKRRAEQSNGTQPPNPAATLAKDLGSHHWLVKALQNQSPTSAD